MLCLTGGEPMMHPDFFEIAECIRDKGFSWGMTTNATLIDYAAALKLKDAGMSTVSVSLDGMERSHDELRQRKGAWKLALRGIKALQNAGFQPQITTVLHQGNYGELESVYKLAGILTASIRSNGAICACLDIENRPELVQGNIRTDSFMDVWNSRFKTFRADRTESCNVCMECSERFICGGDSAHTWDFEHCKPLLCFRDFKDYLRI